MEDEGRPLEVGLQEQASNHLTLREDKIPGSERIRKVRQDLAR